MNTSTEFISRCDDRPLYGSTGTHRLSLAHISQVFRTEGGNGTWALDDVSLTLEGNEIVGIIGPSGCGKSTLLRIAAGLDRPCEGSATFDGKPITGPDYHRSLVFQNPNLFEWLTVSENIAFGLKARHSYEGECFKIPRLIEIMGLQGFEDAYPSQISGGMASRCALARSFIQNPQLILLDEPLSALDAFTRAAIQDEILSMQQSARTSIALVTHDIEEAVYLCDRIIVMSKRPGRIIGEVFVNLAHPRNRISPEFVEMRGTIMHMLENAPAQDELPPHGAASGFSPATEQATR